MHALLRNKANPNLPNKIYSQTSTQIAIINKINEEMLNIFHEHNADIYIILRANMIKCLLILLKN